MVTCIINSIIRLLNTKQWLLCDDNSLALVYKSMILIACIPQSLWMYFPNSFENKQTLDGWIPKPYKHVNHLGLAKLSGNTHKSFFN